MRRSLIMATASTIVLAAAPGAALARHHHGAKNHRGHHHARIEHFGKSWSANSGSSSTSPSADNAGTVASFSGGVLTIKLNDGSTVSGQVTSDTEMECRSAQSSQMSRDDSGSGDDSSGDNNASSGDNQASGENETNDANQNETNDGNENEANENENENQAGQACDSSALTPGTVVREAELRLSGGSASWKKVELER